MRPISRGASTLFLKMEVFVGSFGYHGLLAERVKFLVQEVTKKNKALASSQTSLSITKVAFAKANRALDPSLKKV